MTQEIQHCSTSTHMLSRWTYILSEETILLTQIICPQLKTFVSVLETFNNIHTTLWIFQLLNLIDIFINAPIPSKLPSPRYLNTSIHRNKNMIRYNELYKRYGIYLGIYHWRYRLTTHWRYRLTTGSHKISEALESIDHELEQGHSDVSVMQKESLSHLYNFLIRTPLRPCPQRLNTEP